MAAVIRVVLVRFDEDEDIVKSLVHLYVSGKEVPLARVQRAVWGMLYADDAGIVSKSMGGSAKNDDGHRDCLRSRRPHCIGPEDGDHAVTNT